MEVLTQALGSLGFDWKIALANLVNFLIIFFILKHFFFGSIQKTIAERKAKIEKGLGDAAEAARLVASSESEKQAILQQATIDSAGIVSSAEQKALLVASQVEQNASKEAEAILAAAHKKEADLMKSTTREIESEIPKLAARMVEKILGQKLTAAENESYIKAVLTK
jgi:F-type H+-transporting ATPase subunit b